MKKFSTKDWRISKPSTGSLKFLKTAFILLLFLTCFIGKSNGQYYHTQGTQIVDGNGNPAYFSGMNLGNWLVWEGYLMMGDFNYRTHSQFFNSVKSAFNGNHGQAMDFQHQWRMNYVTSQTIVDLKNLGFNSVRVPFHYNLFWNGTTVTNDGFQYFDRLIGWCRSNGISILLDMHAAPGHQNPGDHSDNNESNSSQPRESVHFWDGNNINIASQIWRHIASRYANEPVIWGYDLINEPVPQPGREYELLNSMITMRNAIRQVDNNHIIVAEGSWWGSDMQKLDWMDGATQSNTGVYSKWDNNLVYQTHHYSDDVNALNGRKSLTNKLNIPLILGEYGESNDSKLLEMTNWCKNNNVGYFPWSFKKMFHDKCLWTIPGNAGYNAVRNYINNGGTPPANAYNDMIAFCNNNIANGKPGQTFHSGWYNAVKPSTTTAPPPSGAPIGQTITLRGSNNLYVSSEDGTQPMYCNRGSAGTWEKFLVVDAGGGKIALRSMNKYVSSENGATSGITCNRTAIGGWEAFTWEQVGTNQVALKGNNNQYISSENGQAVMRCNRPTRGGWETFTYATTSAARLGSDESEALSVSYYPNPVLDQFTYELFDGSKDHKISISDFSGKVVVEKSFDNAGNTNTIDLSGLRSGMYIIKVSDKSRNQTFKIQKQ